MTSPSRRHAHVVGLGLIGGSLALALGERGWVVTGDDHDPLVAASARSQGIVTGHEPLAATELVVIATPARAVVGVARAILARLPGEAVVITDVAGVKAGIVGALDDPRFVGGHPMAGSELRGLAGARRDMFTGCTWVLTPTAHTPPEHYTRVHGVLRELGANVIAMAPEDHDRLVALASHVPHLVAGALMNQAAAVAEEEVVLLQLAAGGFRDMTRIAAGDPGIWPDVLFENRDAVVGALDSLQSRLADLRDTIEHGDGDRLADALRRAAVARRHLPGRALRADQLTYLRVPVSDRPGELATITTAASELGVNIYDIEIAHGIEGVRGTLLLALEAGQEALLADELTRRGFTVGREAP